MKLLIPILFLLFFLPANGFAQLLDPPPLEEGEKGNALREEMPSFPGCEAVADKKERQDCAKRKMLQFVYENLEYPKAARKKKVEGMVVIRFQVGADGLISDAQVVRGIGYGCEEEALRVVEQMPRWNPGWQYGETVPVHFNFPINFKL